MEKLLATKFYIPPTQKKLVSRPRLVERINKGLHRKLTLISAPAGFGKTTLVSEWVEKSCLNGLNECSIAWLSLDENDNELVGFLTYLTEAIQRAEGIDQRFGSDALNMLQSQQPTPIKSVLTSLINQLSALPGKIVLVLDDYHLISQPAIDEAVSFLLDHVPPQLHLFILTRVDPQLPLALLRARSQLNELRAANLRFSFSEASEFLNKAMGLALSDEDITTLETRTEGWIAGLQLVALSMQGLEDTSEFVQSFTGSHHLVLDYLFEEVFNQQAENVQEFLLKTAILDRLTASLCDSVTEQDNSKTILEELERANIFIIPIDEKRKWYRYHPLFSDLLYQRMKENRADELPILHSKASIWYEALGATAEAFHHALKAGDHERAADIIEPISLAMITEGRLSSLLDWVRKLSDELLSKRPWLCINAAWANLLSGQMRSTENLLNLVDSILSNTTPETLNDHNQIYGHVLTIRSFLSRWQYGDFERAIELSQEASKYVAKDSMVAHSALTLNLGITYLMTGNIESAVSVLEEAITVAREGNNHFAALAAYQNLGLAQMKMGYLHRAEEIFQQAIQLGIHWGDGQPLPATGFAHFGLGQVLYEWNKVDESVIHQKRAIKLAELVNEITILIDAYLALSQLKLAQGEITEASEALESAKAILTKTTRVEVTSQLSAQQVHFWLAQGDLTNTLRWIEERKSFFEDGVYYPHMPEYLALAQVLIAQDELEKAKELLVKLQDDAEAHDRNGDLIKILALQAVLLQKLEDSEEALAALEKALILAEPEGFIRTFLDEGPPMAELLNEAVSRGVVSDYATRLLAAFKTTKTEKKLPKIIKTSQGELLEPLSEREIEVLELLAKGLSNQQIASKLLLSLNTVKSHNRNIYNKLSVHNRTQAVTKAKTLGILDPD